MFFHFLCLYKCGYKGILGCPIEAGKPPRGEGSNLCDCKGTKNILNLQQIKVPLIGAFALRMHVWLHSLYCWLVVRRAVARPSAVCLFRDRRGNLPRRFMTTATAPSCRSALTKSQRLRRILVGISCPTSSPPLSFAISLKRERSAVLCLNVKNDAKE